MTVSLAISGARLDLAPQWGGSVLRYSVDGCDILRPTRGPIHSAHWDARDMAAFPLFPFCGRISDGAFAFGGRSIELPANMPPEPHAIHGHGWQMPWQARRQTTDTVDLDYVHTPDAWPWAYRASQKFTLLPNGLDVSLSLTNLSDGSMPAGLGWHPYFPKAGANVTASLNRIWSNGGPEPAPIDLSAGSAMDRHVVDACFDIQGREQVMRWPTHTLHMQADPALSKLIVFVPEGGDYFCVEPISHAPDAVNMQLGSDMTGMKVLAPSETLTGTIRLTVSING